MNDFSVTNPAKLKEWFLCTGATGPLRNCIGPLPMTGAVIVRWTADKPDTVIRGIVPHPESFRIAIQLEPHESEIWNDQRPVWSGVIGANRFRVCTPGAKGRWRRLSACDIVNIFIPASTVRALAGPYGDTANSVLNNNWFSPDRMVLDLLWKILDADALVGAMAAQFRDHLVSALVTYLLQRYAQPADAPGVSSLGGARLQKMLNYMANHLADEVPVAELAQACAMSESHFSREFHKAVGLPPHQYLMKLRLERAHEALRCSNARVIDVAVDLGFTNASHFSRAFVKRYGLAPAAFRRQARIFPGATEPLTA